MERVKIFLKDIKNDRELLKRIFENNEKLKESVWETTYNNNMDMQLEFGELCMGKEHHKYIDIRDHYSSFYLKLKDAERFIENIDKDYLTTEEETIYNRAKELLEIRNNTEYGTDYYYEIDIELDKKAEELLDLIEKDLHEYENVEEEDVFETFVFDLQENYCYEDLYFYKDDDVNYNLYEDISYTKNWN